MTHKPNCWEMMQCGRQPGGEKADMLGVCPAAVDASYDRFNRGKNAGRCCWLVAGTFCKNKAQGSFAQKQESCKHCAFYRQIHSEEGATRLAMDAVNVVALTHSGLVKASNDDRYFMKELPDGAVLLAVLDGLGGNVAGDYAAEILRGKLAGVDGITGNREEKELVELATAIDRVVHEEKAGHPDLEGMGSTFLGVVLREDRAFWVHVGDSRLYCIRNGILAQVTVDQTLARFLVAEGELSQEEVKAHYSRHVMDQFVGCGYAEPESGSLAFLPGEILLLATDGLHKAVSESTISGLVTTGERPEATAEFLIEAALDAGGEDNITVVMAEKRTS